ncbi:MAG: 3-hydroxyacyl-[acyl-carrier-protein] dehydratase [Pseudomonadota bacterium]|nr:3-hydroxyacyl-[acyl-carrier-protein] dehydratase [Pseudomonadota bacterium]
MNTEKWMVIPADHPSLAGHFPDNPIVPGVVLLDEVIQALSDWRPDAQAVGMPVVKFLAPLRPEQPFSVGLVETGPGRVRFECIREGGQLLARGQIALRPE